VRRIEVIFHLFPTRRFVTVDQMTAFSFAVSTFRQVFFRKGLLFIFIPPLRTTSKHFGLFVHLSPFSVFPLGSLSLPRSCLSRKFQKRPTKSFVVPSSPPFAAKTSFVGETPFLWKTFPKQFYFRSARVPPPFLRSPRKQKFLPGAAIDASVTFPRRLFLSFSYFSGLGW